VDLALNCGFDCEIDLYYLEGNFYLGHDEPTHLVPIEWLVERKNRLWIHCKNYSALNKFAEDLNPYNYFWHQNDDFTLTSTNLIWTFPGQQLGQKSILVLPERYLSLDSIDQETLKNVYGVCTDFPSKFMTL
jgi:hypothetical protein